MSKITYEEIIELTKGKPIAKITQAMNACTPGVNWIGSTLKSIREDFNPDRTRHWTREVNHDKLRELLKAIPKTKHKTAAEKREQERLTKVRQKGRSLFYSLFHSVHTYNILNRFLDEQGSLTGEHLRQAFDATTEAQRLAHNAIDDVEGSLRTAQAELISAKESLLALHLLQKVLGEKINLEDQKEKEEEK